MLTKNAISDTEYPVIYFDGVCNLCNGFVQFIIRNDPGRRFRFAALQSARGQTEREVLGDAPDQLGTVILRIGDRRYTESEAALQIARRLRFPWPLLYAGKIVPRFIRDPIYRWVARNRYRWFGQRDSCMIPTPELRGLFLD